MDTYRRLCNELPLHLSLELRNAGIVEVNMRSVFGILGPHPSVGLPHSGRYRVVSNERYTAVFWENIFPSSCLTPRMLRCCWYRELGSIRDQRNHLLCWGYVSTDMISAHLMIRGVTEDHLRFSVWNLCMRCMPGLLGHDVLAPIGHRCYRVFVDEALEFIRHNGIAREISNEEQMEYFCRQEFPPSPNLYIPRMSVRVVESLWEALEYLHLGPITADIITFSELFRTGFQVYRGPTTYGSRFIGYHSCTIAAVSFFEGEPVAICKLSNGSLVGSNGYVPVSLSTFHFVYASDWTAHAIPATDLPTPLLSHFVILDIEA